MIAILVLLLLIGNNLSCSAFQLQHSSRSKFGRIDTLRCSRENVPQKVFDRRSLFKSMSIQVSSGATVALISAPKPSNAIDSNNRTEGYDVQHTEREWAYILSGKQYHILRQGGTERPYSSILEDEERNGEYRCAGCDTPLFDSKAKFHSGTGWPSFATPLKGVEIENVNFIQANLFGAEIRCGTCGGHLGDVFNDGILFVNTPAFISGKRYCVDGAALIFHPADGGEDINGDLPPPVKK